METAGSARLVADRNENGKHAQRPITIVRKKKPRLLRLLYGKGGKKGGGHFCISIGLREWSGGHGTVALVGTKRDGITDKRFLIVEHDSRNSLGGEGGWREDTADSSGEKT